MYSVYVHTSPNGKRYVGVTSVKPENRWRNGLGYEHNQDFFSDILAYGWQNIAHEIVFACETKKEAEDKEREFIAFYDTQNPERGYNCFSGGFKGSFANSRTKERMSVANSDSKNPMYGKHHSQESKELIAITKRGKPLTKECRQKLSRVLGGANNPACRKVLQYDKQMNLVNEYRYIREAARAVGASWSNISTCCQGKQKTCAGYVWRYGV